MKKKPTGIKTRIYLKTLISIILLIFLYFSGIPISFLIFLGFLILLLILFKTKLYEKIEKTLTKKIPSFSKQRPWIKKIIIILIFIVIYTILKQIIFFILRQLGINIKQIFYDRINK